MFYLAAAVSDVYIPVSEIPEHEIHSLGGSLQITIVPRMFSFLFKDGALKATTVPFKLETDPDIIISRAWNALEIYKHQMVMTNILVSIKSFVIIVTKHPETKLLLSGHEAAKGMATEEKIAI